MMCAERIKSAGVVGLAATSARMTVSADPRGEGDNSAWASAAAGRATSSARHKAEAL